jgi:predicted alpha-1,6-mannanase (GH76 family)
MRRGATIGVVAAIVTLGTMASSGCRATAGASPGPSRATAAVASTPAGVALASFNRAFYVETNGRGYFRKSTAGSGRAVFWTTAEMIEMEEDACQAPVKLASTHVVGACMKSFIYYYGTLWTARTWNDDIMWAIIASLRAYRITGNTQYRDLAKRNFDRVYARAWSSDLGGGLWWTTARTGKNTTTNAPAAIAACLLYQALHEKAYLVKAQRIYAWQRAHLFNAKTGVVYDGVASAKGGAGSSPSGSVVDRRTYTYNQGTFIGAADLLYRLTRNMAYYRDAVLALRYTKTSMTTDGILPREENTSSGNRGGFKGIFARWAVRFTQDNRITSYDPWFRQNANSAWDHRNGHGLVGDDWSIQTANGPLVSFGCSSGVVIMEMLSPATK